MWATMVRTAHATISRGNSRRFAATPAVGADYVTSTQPKNVLAIQSHVVYGHAGNSAAVFPMRRCGVNVWPLNTVQFSNHTQYPEGFRGMRIPPKQIMEIGEGLGSIDKLAQCDAVYSGYLGDASQGHHILKLVEKVKNANPSALFCCDPVMGHPEKGCVVSEDVTDFFKDYALTNADVLCPNVLELGILSGVDIKSFDDVVVAARALLARGPSMVLVKHLGRIGSRPTLSGEAAQFEMLLATSEGGSCSFPGQLFHIRRPLFDFEREPVGVGDLTSGLFIANIVKGIQPKSALEHTTSAAAAVMQLTAHYGSYEMQLVAAQDEICNPTQRYSAEEIILTRIPS